MRRLVPTTQFKKDYKALVKRGRDPGKLKSLTELLQEPGPLPQEYRDHPLKGQLHGTRECRIQGDWLLIYEIDGDSVRLIRTGTHSELFNE